jgi:hypothetical protein
MSKMQTVLLVLLLAALLGTAAREAQQTHQWASQVREINTEQAAIQEEIRQMKAERDETTNRVAMLLAEQANVKMEAAELARLRAEESRLKASASPTEDRPDEAAVVDWISRAEQLKRYVSEHPEENIPEMQFLTDREWLLLAVLGPQGTNFGDALQELKSQAESRFAEPVERALQAYAAANEGKFPTALSQLQPYCDSDVEEVLQERYEIRTASTLPADEVKAQRIKTDWVIAGKNTIQQGSADHIAIYANGYTFFW